MALPGQLLGSTSKYVPGPGTHLHEANIYASIVGRISETTPRKLPKGTPPKPFNPSNLPVLSVSRPTSRPVDQPVTGATNSILPEVESIILARITRLTTRQANATILAISPPNATSSAPSAADPLLSSPPVACAHPFPALLRTQDIRATEKDKIKMLESFRPGDIIRAQVISLGDQGGYYLSTARNELGVVLAWDETGEELVPISWKEMGTVEDGKVGAREPRKVAKPF
ncbi:hypothetical protein K402DRAFT_340264 [Aulographum hederae CBS 113979]|uniref:Exosome complex component CSL4 C-terminal domain-containing protein n=1 Tax=Aulographum hederae CBS 113979 TaxID=1176131 RepID=A0A6G1GNC3_9PEZI|nr:hypothetical protein K402DRAFT_340264 [Aulographum hederae CBS 113979]